MIAVSKGNGNNQELFQHENEGGLQIHGNMGKVTVTTEGIIQNEHDTKQVRQEFFQEINVGILPGSLMQETRGHF